MSRKRKPVTPTQRTFYCLQYGDFEDLVKKQYKQYDYNFVADIECGNDTDHTYSGITGLIDGYNAGKLYKFKKTGEYVRLAEGLLQDLVRRGTLPAGDYLISVCW